MITHAVIYKRQGKDPNEKKMPKPEITPIVMNRDTASTLPERNTGKGSDSYRAGIPGLFQKILPN